jgi:hypothetical protein
MQGSASRATARCSSPNGSCLTGARKVRIGGWPWSRVGSRRNRNSLIRFVEAGTLLYGSEPTSENLGSLKAQAIRGAFVDSQKETE